MTDRYRVVRVDTDPPRELRTFRDRVSAESYREAAGPVMGKPLVVQELVGGLWVDTEEVRR